MKTCLRIVSFAFLASAVAHADVDLPFEAPGGVAIAVGVDADFVADLTKNAEGRLLVEGLTSDEGSAAAGRRKLADAGVFPLADMRAMPNLTELPYVDAFASLIVVDHDRLGDGGPDDAGILRVLGWDRAAAIREGGKWRVLEKPRSPDVGIWTHSLHGPDRVPASSDAKLGPWIDSVRWMTAFDVGHSRWAVASAREKLNSRVAGGRVFYLTRSLSNSRNSVLECRDAYSGIRLWDAPIAWSPNAGGGETTYFASSGTLVADEVHVFCYPDVEGFLTAFDARTGERVRTYDQTVQLEPGAEAWGVRGESLVKAPAALAVSQILLDGDESFIQSYKGEMWRVERETGEVRWKFSAGGDFWLVTPCLSDGAIYAALMEPGKAYSPTILRHLVRIDPATGEEIWRTERFENTRCYGIAGPGGGILPVQVFHLEDGKQGNQERFDWLRDGDFKIWGFDPETGERKWSVDGGGYRGYVYTLDDKVMEMPAYRGIKIRDPLTGEMIKNFKYAVDGGGCSFEVFSAKYQIRGSQLSPRFETEAAYFNNGSRPSCEQPSIPAYAGIYTMTAKCNCDHYLPSGFTCAATGRPLKPWPLDKRTRRGEGATLPAAAEDCALDGPVVEDWKLAVDHRGFGAGKAFGWRMMDEEARDELTKRFGKGEKFRWYGREETEPVQAGDIHLVAVTHQWRLEGRRGDAPEPLTDKQIRDMTRKGIPIPKGEAVWSFLAGGRIGSPPVVVGDRAIFACHDGWVYAVRVSDGQLIWKTLAAPQEQRMGAFSQIESSWPCFGVVEHKGQILTVAGRISTMDRGLFAVSIDPETGTQNWRVRLATDPIYAEDGSAELSGDVWVNNWVRVSQTLNMPPQIINGRLRVLGSLMVDPDNPTDQVIGGAGYQVFHE